MACFACYTDEIDKTMIAFEFSDRVSVLSVTKSWALIKRINFSRLFYIPNQYLMKIDLFLKQKK